MKGKITYLLCVILMTNSGIGISQNKFKIIKIGEDCPDVELNMINFRKEKTSISEFKGHMVHPLY
jgi:hypothetical protein